MKQRLCAGWYEGRWWLDLLLPLAWLYRVLSMGRRFYYRQRLSAAASSRRVPVIVIGNITLGGTGKTPLLIALADFLQQKGFKPGIISRGYGSRAPHYPFLVESTSSPVAGGDEPLMLARRTGRPVVIDGNRPRALKYLLDHFDCDMVLSDDGLQHYRLPRDVEIAVVDGNRGLGNGLCLPAGPLRESPARLRQVDWVVVNGPLERAAGIPETYVSMTLQPRSWHRVADDRTVQLTPLPFAEAVHALAGIGNPRRFFATLRAMGLTVKEHSFADHYAYTLKDLQFDDNLPVVMTEKDAAKIRPLVAGIDASNYYYLRVAAELPETFKQSLHNRLTAMMATTTNTVIDTTIS